MKFSTNIYYFYLLLLLSLISFTWEDKLLKTIIIARHGERSKEIQREYGQADSYSDEEKIFGENKKLTVNGFHQAQILGAIAREKYINNLHFLNPDYSPNQFEIFSTQKQRNIFSAEGFISTFYPGSNPQVVFQDKNIDLPDKKDIYLSGSCEYPKDKTKNIKINVINPSHDQRFSIGNCKLNGKYILDHYMDFEPFFEISEEEIKESFNELTNYFKLTFTDDERKRDDFIKNYIKILQNLSFLYFNGYSKNNGLSEKSTQLLKKVRINYFYKKPTEEYQNFAKVNVKFLFKDILQKFDSSCKKKEFLKVKEPQMTVYFGHDFNIIFSLQKFIDDYSFLMDQAKEAINDNDSNEILYFLTAHFTSNFVYELYEDDKKNYYVKIFYDKYLLNNLLKEKSGLEDNKIPLETFRKMMEIDLPDNYVVDCSDPRVD